MNYDTVLEHFNTINEAKGNEKHPLILEALKDKDFILVIQYVLDTSRTFKVSKLKSMSDNSLDQDLFEFLDYLNTKKGATARDKRILTSIASESEAKFTVVNKILRGKTHAGFTNNTMNKLAPGLIPYYSYMRCKGISHLHKIKFPCYSQIKLDGMYHEVVDGVYRTRNGKPLDFSKVPNTTSLKGKYMGECLMVDAKGVTMNRRDSNAIINTAQHGGLTQEQADSIRFQYWDVDTGEASKTPYTRRLQELRGSELDVVECVVVRNMEEAWDHYEAVRALGLEGTILKNFAGEWKDGDSMDQIKLKAILETELEVTGTVDGEDKYKGMVGALICKSSCGGLITDVGMGLSDEDRARTDWVGQIISVDFNEASKSKNKDTYALSHARLVERRLDKTEADDLEYILELKEAKRK